MITEKTIITLTPILIAIIGVAGGWYNSYLTRVKEREANEIIHLNLEAEKRRLELELQESKRDNTILEKVRFDLSLVAANEINTCIDYIFNRTKVDRFLILLACNGKYPPKYVTANFERHKSGQYMILSIGANSKYVSFEGDSYYQNMLNIIEQVGTVDYHISDMPECDYKEIMLSEKLHHSKVFFLRRKFIDEENHLLAFCSCATHESEAFTHEEDLVCKLQIDKIKSIFKRI